MRGSLRQQDVSLKDAIAASKVAAGGPGATQGTSKAPAKSKFKAGQKQGPKATGRAPVPAEEPPGQDGAQVATKGRSRLAGRRRGVSKAYEVTAET